MFNGLLKLYIVRYLQTKKFWLQRFQFGMLILYTNLDKKIKEKKLNFKSGQNNFYVYVLIKYLIHFHN